MNALEVINNVKVYEVNDKETASIVKQYIVVKSHWNRSELIVLEFKDGVRLTVAASDLEKAIRNARNA